MNAIQLLRQMHADTKMRFKVILSSDDPAHAAEQWGELQSLLELHERLEDEFVYAPLFEEMGGGTPLGDWAVQHEADVATVKQFVEAADQFEPATPDWRTIIGTIVDALNKHVADEEGQIFGRIEQVWDARRLEEAGQQMQKVRDSAVPGGKPRVAPAKSARRAAAQTSSPAQQTR
jgi:Hemerythrin HHE cation binding domain